MPCFHPNRVFAALPGAALLLSRVASHIQNSIVRGIFLFVAAMAFAVGNADAQVYAQNGIHITDTGFDEDGGNATFQIWSTTGSNQGVDMSVRNASTTNAATLNTDFRHLVGASTQNIVRTTLPGSGTPRNVEIPIVNDSDVEGKETFIFRVVVSGGSTIDVPMTIHDDDRAFRIESFGIARTSFPETNSWGSFSVVVANTASSTVAISWTTVDGKAKLGQDYRRSGTQTHPGVPAGVTISINLGIINDADQEDAETFILRLTVGGAEYDITYTIEKNDQPVATLSLSPQGNQIAEGDTQVYTVTLAPAQTNALTVNCRTQGGAAVAGQDYTALDQLLTFNPGETSHTCSLVTIADGLDEAVNEIVEFGLANLTGSVTETDGSGGVSIASGHDNFNVTIVDGDDPPMIWLEQANRTDLEVTEGTATFEFTVRLSAASGKTDFAVGYRLSGTATPGYDENLTPPETGEDYTVSYLLTGNSLTPARTVVGTENFFGRPLTDGTGQIVLFAGETEQTLTVHVNDDQLTETEETIVLELLQDPNQAVNQNITNATNLADLTVDQNRKTATLTLASDEVGTAKLLRQPGDEDCTDNTCRVGEGDGAVPFQVEMNFDEPPSTIRVSLTNDGTPSAAQEGDGTNEGDDYAPLAAGTSPLAITQGTSSQFTVNIHDDDESEGREEFMVVVQGPSGTSFMQQFTVSIVDNDGPDPILRLTGKHAIARAEALIENQPRLIPMLRDPDDRSEFKLRATDGGVEAAGGFRVETVWGATARSISTDRGDEHVHQLTTLGAHFRTSELLHLGGMLQIDRSEMKPGGQGVSGEIGGNGWMAGPYFVARDASHPLFFEGRLLYGRASNDIEDIVLGEGATARSASFDSARWLAQARVEGSYQLGIGGATLIPLADLSHALDEMEPFRDSDNEQVAGQTIAVSKLQLGAELEIPIETAQGDLRIKPGMRFVASDTSGGTFPDGAKGLRLRGRIDFGVDYRLGDDFVLGFGSFYSGLGRKDLETYGAGLDLQLEF